jgi:hypothetical protein
VSIIIIVWISTQCLFQKLIYYCEDSAVCSVRRLGVVRPRFERSIFDRVFLEIEFCESIKAYLLGLAPVGHKLVGNQPNFTHGGLLEIA